MNNGGFENLEQPAVAECCLPLLLCTYTELRRSRRRRTAERSCALRPGRRPRPYRRVCLRRTVQERLPASHTVAGSQHRPPLACLLNLVAPVRSEDAGRAASQLLPRFGCTAGRTTGPPRLGLASHAAVTQAMRI